ncbi:SpoIIE family protein phosphatase [Thiocapsa sp.]|uniref:SpoIIE family protein phosphatase n=1 Tax=Thiocapsa sp. TaxID=2024551 RepID=UPI0025E1210E|nr:SpoIIE family protein phosphatase [Thiocapsa sp.]
MAPPLDADSQVDYSGGDRQESGLHEWQSVARHALFKGVPFDGLRPILARCAIQELEIGQVLLAPGQANRKLFLVLDGQLKAHIDHIDSEEGFFIGPGECTGEISVIDSKPATAFVVAEATSRVLAVAEEDLWGGLLQHPRIARNFMQLFAERFRARTRVMQKALEQQLRFEHMQKELAIAQEIQLGMLPHDLDLDLGPEIDLAAEIMPASLVGGDFYDVIPMPPDEYGVAIGDVSGKGVPAALFMVRTLTLLRTELLKSQPLEDALRNVNLRLCEENAASMFATLIVAIVNKSTGQLRYVNAGHDPVLFGERGRDYRPLPPPSGILIGLDETATYVVESLTLREQDVLVLYTDGVTEAMDREHRLFTLDRLTACLNARRAGSAQGLADAVTVAVKTFSAGAAPSDDLTLVVLRFLGT